MQEINWHCASFAALSNKELYEILALRAEVFVVEQDCVYQDLDGCDLQCFHLTGRDKLSTSKLLGENSSRQVEEQLGSLLAYARLVPPGVKYSDVSIGRVVSHSEVRKSGLGKSLMRQAILQCEKLWPREAIRISAQHHLEKFYQDFGFKTVSAPYLEDDIPHVEMQRHGF